MQLERFIIIHLVSGATPKALRKAIKAAGYVAGPPLAPRVARVLLQINDGCNPPLAALPTNKEVAEAIASHLPYQSVVQVRDLGPLSFAIGIA